MGDRTTVVLAILTSQVAEAKALFGEDASEGELLGELTEFTFYEVNYGDLPFLNKFRETGIPYDSSWNDGNGYASGTEYFRLDAKGGSVLKLVYVEDRNPDLDQLLNRIDSHKDLKTYILEHRENIQPISWDNQEEYVKIFKATKLLAG